ncbi:putative ankyrin repeat protein RF_0381 [Coccinella septempunctata]|uniref:putative ankyrin repeat protein RF_0381 n=1 Tax=Coccinella septempunctata TaxID=41139 RepID=UPI001D08307D|nr:putative ankyrin repeat protein RF_0381 [Coccinella septempunctata]
MSSILLPPYLPFHDLVKHEVNVYKIVNVLQQYLRSNNIDVNTKDPNTKQALVHYACYSKSLSFGSVFLDTFHEEIDIHAKTSNNETPLHFAVQRGNKGTVETLLRLGAKSNVGRSNDGQTPIHLACRKKGSVDILKMLLFDPTVDINAQDNRKCTGLHHAVSENDIYMVKLLLKHGADPNARDKSNATPLHIAARRSYNLIIDELLTNRALVNVADIYGVTPLHLAVTTSNEYAVRKFLEYAGDPNFSPNVEKINIVHSALLQNNTTILSLILKYSDNIDVVDEKSLTPLEKAVEIGDEKKVKILLKYTTNPEVMRNLIMISVSKGDMKITKLLLESKAVAFINTISKNGSFPLLEAVNWRRIDYLALLLAYGADINLKSKDGHTALTKASKYRFYEIEQFLSQPEKFSSYITSYIE